jgi:type I restriction enzyme R subunit
MNKKELTEADTRTKFIAPVLVGPSGKWNVIIVRGKTVRRGEAKKADYILYLKPGS